MREGRQVLRIGANNGKWPNRDGELLGCDPRNVLKGTLFKRTPLDWQKLVNVRAGCDVFALEKRIEMRYIHS